MRAVTNEAQELEIANRLGITKPNKPKEVAEFLIRWNVYKEVVGEFRSERLDSWGGFDIIAKNAIAVKTTRRNLDVIEAQEKALEAFGETVRLAVTAYEQAEHEYYKAIEAEAERPRREFEKAKNNFIAVLEKEQRSLKYRMSRSKHSWNAPADSPETIQYNEWDNRSTLISYILQEARYMSQKDGVEFSEQAVLDYIKENSYQSEAILERFATLVNA